MRTLVGTLLVFFLGIFITYFLADFYNDLNDDSRTEFSRRESDTLQLSVLKVINLDDDRGHTLASIMRTSPNMTVPRFREFNSLPGKEVFAVGEIPDTSQMGNIPDGFHFIPMVEHRDRESFEREISEQYNRSIQITDFPDGQVSGNRSVYWPIFLHNLDIPFLGRDVMSDPDRKTALDFLIFTGDVSYSSPVPNVQGTASFTKFFEIMITPEGVTGVISLFTALQPRIDANTNSLDFIKGGNGGRRITLEQIQGGEKTLVYEVGDADDLIYEREIFLSDLTQFVFKVYDHEEFDNVESTIVFMSIGLTVSLALACWEFFRSRASKKEREASIAKSKFLSNISHEIRTPINGIVGISDVLSKEALPEGAEKYVKIIESCSSSLLSLLNNVLAMSKIDAGKIENNKRDFVMKTVVLRTVRDSWEVLLSKRSSIDHIKVVFTENVPLREIHANDTHVFQILNNLISNAVKFTDEGYIEVKIDAENTGDDTTMISMAIRDTGIGMDEKAVKKLFKPFNRVHNGNNEKEGTGLGLVISMNLAKNMGGGISCKSTVGEGTTFLATFVVDGEIGQGMKEEVIVFDRETSRDIEVGVVETPEKVTCRIKEDASILVVEDNKVNRLVLRKMLQSIGAGNVDFAEDGQKCIVLTKLKRYDLIFMDKFMPIMDGLEAIKHIRTDFDCVSKSSPIIFLSADAEDKTIAECMNAGANGFLPKPYRLFALTEKMKSIVPDIIIY